MTLRSLYERQVCRIVQMLFKSARVRAIAAFATATGGVVRFGVEDDGRRVGVSLGRTTLEELANYIKQNTDPPQFPSITYEGPENSAVVTVAISESSIKPVWAFGRAYRRVGRTNQVLSREEAQRLADATTGRTWDALLCPGLDVAHLNRDAVESFLRRAGQDIATSTESVLDNLNLRTANGLCYGAALLFAANPQRFVVDAQVKCGRFRGTTSVDFLDERTLEGDLWSQLEESLRFVTRNTRQAIRITGRPEREIIPEYPDAAVREAVTNAICHRDYTGAGTVQVRIYDDRLEVWNPGALPWDLSIEQLYVEHVSRPRNRRIAMAFYRARLIEHWGTGTLRIIQAYRASGHPDPEFRHEMGTFMVRLLPASAVESGGTFAVLGDRQSRALHYLDEHGSIASGEYASLNKVSLTQALVDLRQLVRDGVLIRVGAGRSTRYARRHGAP